MTRARSAILVLAFTASAQAQCPVDWTAAASGPGARQNHAMTLADDVIVMFGGRTPSYTAEIWHWNGAWATVTSSGPSARSHHAMAWDPIRERVVLFGGGAPSALADTWEYNPANQTWTQRLSADSPPARSDHAMAWDADHDRIILFGGIDVTRFADTWAWNGENWQQLFVSGPGARSGHSMTTDAVHNRIVLFGGYNGAVRLSETWQWANAAWSLVPAPGPVARQHAALEYDAAHGRVILFAGQACPCVDGRLNDTWSLDGDAWSLVNAGDASHRDQHAMAFFPAAAGMVMFGGSGPGAAFLADTWTMRTSAAPVLTVQPQSQAAALGAPVSFGISVESDAPVTYQWRRDLVPLVNDARIFGATSSTFSLLFTMFDDQGTYDCIVQSPCGGTVSHPATLSFGDPCGNADFDGDGDTGTDADIEAFFACIGGHCCATCGSADYDADGDTGTDADIEAYFRVLSGGC